MGTKSNVYLTLSEKGFESDGAEGNWGSTVANKTGLIEVLDYSFGVKQVGTEEAGRPRSVERIERSLFQFKRYVDNRSPLLFEYCVKGEYLKEAELRVFGTDPASPYLKYTMSFVHVSSYDANGGDDLPTETIQLAYGQMRVTFEGVSRAWSWVFETPTDLHLL